MSLIIIAEWNWGSIKKAIITNHRDYVHTGRNGQIVEFTVYTHGKWNDRWSFFLLIFIALQLNIYTTAEGLTKCNNEFLGEVHEKFSDNIHGKWQVHDWI